MFFASVVRPKLQLLQPNASQYILEEGDSANLTCKIIEGLPEPLLSFSKNGVDLSKEMTSSLLLTNVTDSDEGMYMCKAQNAGGYFADSKHIRVKSELRSGNMGNIFLQLVSQHCCDAS